VETISALRVKPCLMRPFYAGQKSTWGRLPSKRSKLVGTLLLTSLTGFVGGEVSVREVGEQRVASFSVAVNRKTGSGEQQTLWVRVSCWNKLADVANSYLKTGSLVQIQASWMRASAYMDREGQPQASLDITADRLVLLDRVNGDAPTDTDPDMADVPF
jgi:single stranded DNA-binding protein